MGLPQDISQNPKDMARLHLNSRQKASQRDASEFDLFFLEMEAPSLMPRIWQDSMATSPTKAAHEYTGLSLLPIPTPWTHESSTYISDMVSYGTQFSFRMHSGNSMLFFSRDQRKQAHRVDESVTCAAGRKGQDRPTRTTPEHTGSMQFKDKQKSPALP